MWILTLPLLLAQMDPSVVRPAVQDSAAPAGFEQVASRKAHKARKAPKAQKARKARKAVKARKHRTPMGASAKQASKSRVLPKAHKARKTIRTA